VKILYVSNLYGDLARGGAERIVAQEAEASADAGNDVVVVSGERKRKLPKGVCLPGEPWLCPPPGSPEEVAASYEAAVARTAVKGRPRLIRYHPANIYFYADDHLHSWPVRLLWHLIDMINRRSAGTLSRILDLEKPEVVHTHNLMGLGFLIPRLLRRRKIRHVHTVHDVQLLHPSGLLPPSGRLSLPARVYAAVMRRLMGSPAAVVFPSEFLRDLHARHGFFKGSAVEVVRNPAPVVSLAARPVPSKPAFLFAGQLEPHKGILFLLDVWSAWPDRGDVTFEIAGAGSLEPEVRRRAETIPGVRVLGKLGPDEILAALSRSAYLVFPSRAVENAPTVIMESLSRGTPVVAASTGGVPELITEGVTGFLFKPGDPETCLAALRRAVAALPDWSWYFERCMKKAGELSLEHHVERLLRLYQLG
jgi:glycosyltransferase involved in cell wall biosynthesis